MTAGYSGTPLAKKLGLTAGLRVWLANMPDTVRAEIDPAAIGVVECARAEPGIDAAHLFVTDRALMAGHLTTLRPLLAPAGFVWVSWPKKAAKVPTDITEDIIRAVALPMGFVDIKVCAVDAVWSGLKLVIRKELR